MGPGSHRIWADVELIPVCGPNVRRLRDHRAPRNPRDVPALWARAPGATPVPELAGPDLYARALYSTSALVLRASPLRSTSVRGLGDLQRPERHVDGRLRPV